MWPAASIDHFILLCRGSLAAGLALRGENSVDVGEAALDAGFVLPMTGADERHCAHGQCRAQSASAAKIGLGMLSLPAAAGTSADVLLCIDDYSIGSLETLAAADSPQQIHRPAAIFGLRGFGARDANVRSSIERGVYRVPDDLAKGWITRPKERRISAAITTSEVHRDFSIGRSS